MTPRRSRVVILGGGMAGMTAAWRLSNPEHVDQIESITVYQRGWRLGGKGASSRGVHDRIEEHGLHVWLGYYENAFCVLQEVYAELDRPKTDPDCVIKTWHDALKPATKVGLEELRGDQWRHWIGDFGTNGLVPGDGVQTESMTPAGFVHRAISLLRDFFGSQLSPSTAGADRGGAWIALRGALGLALEITRIGTDLAASVSNPRARFGLLGALESAQAALHDVACEDDEVRRTWELSSVVISCLRGLFAHSKNGQLPEYRDLNHWDFREWISMNGAGENAVNSTLVRGLYDLVFGYEQGDPDRPGFGAGLGVFMAGKTFFDYKGAIFWKMQAGMGDVVFAPMYEALVKRGVSFEFFHNVENVGISEDCVQSVRFGVQAQLHTGQRHYEPLRRTGNLPTFPAGPDPDQLAENPADVGAESWWERDKKVATVELEAGSDFDAVVFAIPIAMAREITPELCARSDEWNKMVHGLGAVATQAFQLWMAETDEELGWPTPGATMSGYVKPFDTWSSMPQLLRVESWPENDCPASVHYFCTTMPTPTDLPEHPAYQQQALEAVHASARQFIENHIAHLLPASVTTSGFRWELLCGSGTAHGPDRLASQYLRANVDPSDMYVQSLPGTDQLRLRADQSGFDGLFLAGDWTDNGANAGCIEAAVLSGINAANAVVGRPLTTNVRGSYLPLNDRE